MIPPRERSRSTSHLPENTTWMRGGQRSRGSTLLTFHLPDSSQWKREKRRQHTINITLLPDMLVIIVISLHRHRHCVVSLTSSISFQHNEGGAADAQKMPSPSVPVSTPPPPAPPPAAQTPPQPVAPDGGIELRQLADVLRELKLTMWEIEKWALLQGLNSIDFYAEKLSIPS